MLVGCASVKILTTRVNIKWPFNGQLFRWYSTGFWGRKKFWFMRAYSLDTKVWRSLPWKVARRGLGLSHTNIWCETAREMWVELTCQCCMLANDGNLQKRGQNKPFSQLTSHFRVKSLEKLPCETIVSGSLVSTACFKWVHYSCSKRSSIILAWT